MGTAVKSVTRDHRLLKALSPYEEIPALDVDVALPHLPVYTRHLLRRTPAGGLCDPQTACEGNRLSGA